MMNRVWLCGFAVLLFVASGQAQFEGMTSRIPAGSNSLVLINVEKLLSSPIAVRERWSARRDASYAAGVSAIPPDATEVVLASQSDFEFGRSVWELGIVKLQGERNVSAVAQRYGGTMDSIAGRDAAKLPNDQFVVQVSKTMMAAHTPANRQDVSRWLKSTDISAGSRLSPYLQQAFSYASRVGTPVIMALDVSGVLSAREISERLKTFELNKEYDQAAATKLIQGVQGITLGVTVGDSITGAIRVDFSEPPGAIAEIGRPLLLEILTRQGAMIDDVYSWKPSISGNTFLLTGSLGASGMRRVLSVLELPLALAESLDKAAATGGSDESKARIASQQYYNSVSSLLNDLREKPKRDNVKTFGQAAMWYDRYARKIDQLPVLNVDEELLAYGTYVASGLRAAEGAMKGVGMRGTQRTASNNQWVGGYYQNYGGYRAGQGYGGNQWGTGGYSVYLSGARASVREKGRTDAIIRGQERTRGAASVQQIWQELDQATAQVRKSMTQKFQIEF